MKHFYPGNGFSNKAIAESMNPDFSDHIEQILQQELPGTRSHVKMIPPGRELTIKKEDESLVRYSSVLFLLFPIDGEIFTCLTKRNPAMKTHPGQISFPGGKIEKGESPKATALREAEEEVGIIPADVRILGRLSELYIPVSKFSISPFVGWTDQKPSFSLNKNEAEKLILFPVQEFLRKPKLDSIELETVTGPLVVPYYPYDGEIIWGATAMILTELFDLLAEGTITRQ